MTMLGHLRVVDLTRDLGVHASGLLARLGAEVVRAHPCRDEDRAFSAADAAVLAGDELLAAIDDADILFRGPEQDVPSLAADALARRNPRLIDIAVHAFDGDGPNLHRPAADLTIMARSGLMTIIGDPDRPPLTLPGRQAWALAGIQAAIAALVALHARAVDGAGQQGWVSAFRSTVLANYREPLTWTWTGRVGTRTGNLLVRGKSGVRQVWEAQDGFVTWSLVDNPPMMRAMIARMAEDGAAGPLATIDWDAILVADVPRETLIDWEEVIARWIATKPCAWLAGQSARHGMGLSAIDAVGDVLASAHLAERGFWEERSIDGATVRIPGPLFREVTP